MSAYKIQMPGNNPEESIQHGIQWKMELNKTVLQYLFQQCTDTKVYTHIASLLKVEDFSAIFGEKKHVS